MKKRIALLTLDYKFAQHQCNQLKKLFGSSVEISMHSENSDAFTETTKADLYISAVPSLYYKAASILPPKSKVIMQSSTITKAAYNQILEIPSGSTVLLVNDTYVSTMAVLSLLHNLGLDHLQYIPYYPGTDIPHNVSLALTPGEVNLVPENIDQIVDIGQRVFDADSLTEIAIHLKMEHLLTEKNFIKHLDTIKIVKDNLISQLNNINVIEGQMMSLLNVMDDGILILDKEGHITTFNGKASSIIGSKYNLVDSKIQDIIPGIDYEEVFRLSLPTENTLLEFDSKNITVKVIPVVSAQMTNGAVVIVNDFESKEKTQHELRSQLRKKNNTAKYTFNDIITQNESMIAIKNLVKKQVSSNAPVLILGESGTGKEMFAQAIHNASSRSKYPFFAVNCAALPENLLESELFGYEEGAFTGARKGGKPGFFELAHEGTIFLDEIGETNLALQARLLRVLEEREVIRIGGNKTIPIDIKIISATNKPLWDLVEEGKFRTDLFYRINVLPLSIPPLRERKNDIPILLTHFMKNINANFTFDSQAEKTLNNYTWHGNLRELRNCVEYLDSLGKNIIEASDLSNILQRKTIKNENNEFIDEDLQVFFGTIKYEKEDYAFVLECLFDSYKKRKRIGRRSILQKSKEKDIFLSEDQIRKMLTIMEMHGLVRLSNGRGGTMITQLGIKAYNALKQ